MVLLFVCFSAHQACCMLGDNAPYETARCNGISHQKPPDPTVQDRLRVLGQAYVILLLPLEPSMVDAKMLPDTASVPGILTSIAP